jgi:hypothetical protein
MIYFAVVRKKREERFSFLAAELEAGGRGAAGEVSHVPDLNVGRPS